MLETLLNIDRALTLSLNGSDSLFFDGFATAVTATATWIPAAIVLFCVIVRAGEMREILLTILAIGLCLLLADQVASSVFKPMIARPRPAGDPELMYLIDVVNGYRGGKYGFFSSHASNTFAVATFMSLLVRYRAFTFSLVVWALLNCWSRVYLGVHYVGDITAGTIWGIIVGYGVYWLFRRFVPARATSGTIGNDQRTAGGYAIADIRLVMLTLVILYIYCCIRGFLFTN